MTLQVQLEITDRVPLRGTVRVGGELPVAFEGWMELRAHLQGSPMSDAGLSEQELRVASLAAEGLSNAEIGECLSLSPRTVQWHLNNAFKKMGVRSRTELAVRLLSSNYDAV